MAFTKGISGNPKGRPKKITNINEKAELLLDKHDNFGDELLGVLIVKAREGNIDALRTVLQLAGKI